MKNILLVLFVCIGLSSCKEGMFLSEVFYNINVFNRSAGTVYMWRSYNYPDTSLPLDKPALVKIRPGKDYSISSSQKWENELRSKPSQTMSIFILDSVVYIGQNWDSVRANDRVLHRYDLRAEDLVNINYTVNYQ
ncbi:hypothetical protein [Flavipsychrobacter stenotrophus]|nr:hypothetical protein [Flavipsychrobacter stenotrophus]